MKNIMSFFEGEEKKMFLETEKLHQALTHLRYEGKPSRNKNLEGLRTAIQNLEGIFRTHRSFQGKAVFPFLKSHIPRHEAAIHLLEAEHKDIKNSLWKLRRTKRDLSDAKIYGCGIYLISLMRHHIAFEESYIQKSLRKELRADERRAVTGRVSQWMKKEREPKIVKGCTAKK